MRYFIGSIPFFDANMFVHGYRLMTQDGNKLLGAAEDFRMLGDTLQTPVFDYVEQLGVGPFAGDSDFFIDIGKYQILMGTPLNMKISPDRLVCIISNDSLDDTAVGAKLIILKEKGYRLAVSGLPSGADFENMIGFFDFVILDYKADNFPNSFNLVKKHVKAIKVVVTNIPDKRSFDKLVSTKDILLSGDFFRMPVTSGSVEISPLKVNAMHLLKQINDESFDLSDAAKTIERDPALSISLLHFINSANPNRSKEISSIRGAVAILGQKEVRKWATIAISVGMGDDRPQEITRISLIRAKFAENLAPAFEMGIKSGSLFMAGLFSMLDAILQMPMERAIKEVALEAEIQNALLNNEGRIYEVLSLVFAYERADWHQSSMKMVRYDIDIDIITKAFIDALVWYKELLDTIDEGKRSADEGGDKDSSGGDEN